MAIGLQTHIWNNNLRSMALLAGFPVLLTGMVFAAELMLLATGDIGTTGSIGGDVAHAGSLLLAAVPIALVASGAWFAVAYVANQAIIDLATGARPVARKDMPELYNLLENLCISRGMATPTLRIIETPAMNAFASGLREGRFCVTVTRGLIDTLDRDELEAVLAHELTHIINRDVRTMVIAAIFAGVITLAAELIYRVMGFGGGRRESRSKGAALFFVIALAAAAIGSLLAVVIRMTLSRSREYVADAGSVELTKNPDAMISALQKISGNARLDAPDMVRGMFIDSGKKSGLMDLFATHPPIEKRIAALQRYAGGRVGEASVTADPASPKGPWG